MPKSMPLNAEGLIAATDRDYVTYMMFGIAAYGVWLVVSGQ